jgi:hypothetical protein
MAISLRLAARSFFIFLVPERLGGVAPRWARSISRLGEKVRRYGKNILAELRGAGNFNPDLLGVLQ